ncbi:MAG: hypothetical protein H6Q68_606 [Firmicutes bacterium]|nr:hypothetical protein [Bacillota bacterium]
MLSNIMSLLLMMAVPILLYMGLKARMRKETTWKRYLVAAGSVFILLAIIAPR